MQGSQRRTGHVVGLEASLRGSFLVGRLVHWAQSMCSGTLTTQVRYPIFFSLQRSSLTVNWSTSLQWSDSRRIYDCKFFHFFQTPMAHAWFCYIRFYHIYEGSKWANSLAKLIRVWMHGLFIANLTIGWNGQIAMKSITHINDSAYMPRTILILARLKTEQRFKWGVLVISLSYI